MASSRSGQTSSADATVRITRCQPSIFTDTSAYRCGPKAPPPSWNRSTLVEVTREVEVERRISASEEAWAVCAKFDETFDSEDGTFRDVLDFMFNDEFDFDAIRPEVLQNILLLAAKMQLIYWDAEDQDDLWPTLRNSWAVIEHYCQDVLEQPGS